MGKRYFYFKFDGVQRKRIYESIIVIKHYQFVISRMVNESIYE